MAGQLNIAPTSRAREPPRPADAALLRRVCNIEAIESQLPNYRITRVIGVGAGAKIYLAISRKSALPFAVKHVTRETPEDERFLAQAENEFDVASRLDHPCLRKYFSIHRVKKRLQLRELVVLMEFIDGLTVEKALPNRMNSFITLFYRVAGALHAMHTAGYVHTDIKPNNIMIAKGGLVKIIDFGQSCKIGHRKERIQGTPDYIAPEQVRRLPLDQRTDVFNLGATMYWVLTQETFPTYLRGAETVGSANVIQSHKPIAPHERNAKIPLALSKLVMECCREKPADRPADMKQVMARLLVVRKLWNKYIESVRESKTGEPAPEPVAEGPLIVEGEA
jgi:serine/threonine-protein kinase